MFDIAANAVDLPVNFNQNGAGDNASVSTFINALFGSNVGDVRHPATMRAGMITAAQNSRDGYWLITDQAQGLILSNWLSIWLNGIFQNGNLNAVDVRLTASDRLLFSQLALYIQQNNMALFVPRIAYHGPVSNTNPAPVYTISGYDRLDLCFSANELQNGMQIGSLATVLSIVYFLSLFATGAHIVAITSPLDYQGLVNNPPAFWTLFQSSSYIKWRDAGPLNAYAGTAYMHSHYSGSKGVSNIGASYAYPNTVTSTGTPTVCPFVCSLLVGATAHSQPNTFFQLEGWPGTATQLFGAFGAHAQDFAAHQATKWNISTYGASPFSEKRGTTVFLAPADWNTNRLVHTVTWPSYQGTKTLQGWYDGDLIRPDPQLI
jgi:hypothetical protein